MLIGLSGKKQAGKDFFANLFKEILAYDSMFSMHYPVQNKKFADPMKKMADIFLGEGFTKEWEESGSKFREGALPVFWNKHGKPMTRRQFLQELGTDAIRNNLHEDAWVNATFANFNTDRHNWIITDVRFPNEARAIEERNGLVIRINRPDLESTDNHPSETALDNYDFDFVFENNLQKELMAKFIRKEILPIVKPDINLIK